MKKFLVASALVALGSVAQAATVLAVCVPAPANYQGQSGGGDESCTVAIPDGATVTSVTVVGAVDIVYDPFTSGGSADWTFNLSGTAFDLSGTHLQAGGTTFDSSGALACPAADAVACADILDGAFIVTDAYVGTAGVTGASFNKQITIAYDPYVDPGPTPEVPEPSTYAMMAAGLVGFYMVRRKS